MKLISKKVVNGQANMLWSTNGASQTDIAETMMLMLLNAQDENIAVSAEITDWADCETMEHLHWRQEFQAAIEAAGGEIVARNGKHYVQIKE
jgi:hypothetical protein